MVKTTELALSAGKMNEPSWKERMAIALARDIIDGERIISGAHTEISFAAAMLAQKMHAPNVKLQLGHLLSRQRRRSAGPAAQNIDRLSHAALGGDRLRSHGNVHVFRRSGRTRLLRRQA